MQVLERPVRKVPALQGLTVCTVFFENSTRTRISFELAARRMSADVVSFAASSSSLSKGESLRDTIETLRCLQGRRLSSCGTKASGAAHLGAAQFSGKPTIKRGRRTAGDPTQALLDAYTVRQ